MHLQSQLRAPLIVLIIVDLCFSIPNVVDHTNAKQNTFDLNRRPNVIDTSDNSIHSFNDGGGGGDGGDNGTAKQISNNNPLNFLITNFLSDGEIERRIQFNSITAKETLVSKSG